MRTKPIAIALSIIMLLSVPILQANAEDTGIGTASGTGTSSIERMGTMLYASADTGTDTASGTRTSSIEKVSVPQSTYSVSTSIQSFNLNASGGGTLKYSSSNTAVATVSSKGVVKVKKNGTAYVTVSNEVSSKKVTVKVSSYKAANGKFVEAMGNIDGKSGDSTGREIRVKNYPGYKSSDHSRAWGFIIRCNDPEIADKAALAVTYIANNNNFGYNSRKPTSQSTVYKRAAIYSAIVKTIGKNPSKTDLKKITSINKKADTSCTPTLLAGYWLYYNMSDKISLKWKSPYDDVAYNYYCGAVNVEYHQLEKAIKHVNSVYKSKGMLEPFTIIYISASDRSSFFSKSNISNNLKRGDIICSCPNYKKSGHTGMMM